MATTLTETPISPNALRGESRLLSWTLANGEAGDSAQFTEFADKCVQFAGTFGAGGTVILEGSNDATPSTWSPLTDPQANAISKTAAAIEQILETPMWIRPRVTAGDGTTAITVKLVVRRGRGRAV